MKDDTVKNETLDEAIAAIKADTLSAAERGDARARVEAALASHRGPQEIVSNSPNTLDSSAAENWDSIEDYISAIPAYLANQLSPKQALLFEEERRQSLPLRRALREARGADREALAGLGVRKPNKLRWFAAAATVAAVAIALFITLPDLPSFNQTQVAQVDEIDGELYQLVDGGLVALEPGTWINGLQRIRSGSGSSALITLDDGSQIEVDERSELSMTRRGSGNRIDVSRGRILVAASPQGSGTLDVFTDEFMVSVTGTIFEVAHGAKGSRVAVIEGSVNVLLQGNTSSIEPGQIMDSRRESLALSVADEIAWSKDADEYVAMMQEIADLQQDLREVLDTQPRYSTRLLDIVPADTAMYVAVPNAPEKAAEVYEVIRARMQGSELLGEMWNEFESGSEAQYLDEIMSWLGQIGATLGDETVFALAAVSEQTDMVPLVLSEVDAESFRTAFDVQVQRLQDVLAAENVDTDFEIRIIENPADAAPNELSILLVDDLLVATIGEEMMQDMFATLQSGNSAFVDTPLHEILQASYQQGTELVGAVDIPQLFSAPETAAEIAQASEELAQAGLHNAKYLIAQHQEQNGSTTLTADIFFEGEREGAMAWLANPGPMGSLEFFSTDTTFAAAMLIKEPEAILNDLGPIELPDDFDAHAELELFYNVIGILGGEMALGLDGPALPTPAWKVVVEAYDQTILQESIEWSVARFNEYAIEQGIEASIELIAMSIDGYDSYWVLLDANIQPSEDIDFTFESASFHYAYVDGYLVAAPNDGLVDRAISYYESGSGLQTDEEFRELLARDGYLDFSAILFNRFGELFDDIIQSLPADMTEDQQVAVAALDSETGASMTSLLALPDAIHFAHSGSAQLPTQLLSQLAVLRPLLESASESDTVEK
ncbi:MAG: FecR family protein [Pseudohongiellaceae bacterium]